MIHHVFLVLSVLTTLPVYSQIPFNEFLEKSYEEYLDFHPQQRTSIGEKKHYDRLDDYSPAAEEQQHQMWQRQLSDLSRYDRSKLSKDDQLSYDLMQLIGLEKLATYRFRDHNYILEHMDGPHTNLPAFMVNKHKIESLADAHAYLARLEGVGDQFAQVIERVKRAQKAGITVPKFSLEQINRDIANFLDSQPWQVSGSVNPLWSDWQAKVDKLNLPDADKKKLIQDGRTAILTIVGPAYRQLQVAVQEQLTFADNRAGAWKHPRGGDYYLERLNHYTSMYDADPLKINQLGIDEVKRLHDEISNLMPAFKFKGSLKKFFSHVARLKQSRCPNSDAGREHCLNLNHKFLDNIQQIMPKYLNLKVPDQLVVRRVEAFRERSAGLAFYEPPSADHSRPGVYYLNLYDLDRVTVYEMEALAYHEGIPGHHLQVSVAQSLDVPKFRKYYWQTAFGEGWALYSEYFPKELGMYQDPLMEFGRLSMELWRACRLVIDTGIHALKWSYDDAVEYLTDNTAASRSEAEGSVGRYIVWPGQAVAYKIGMNKILELRVKARKKLGDRFDLAKFHDQVLGAGPMPLVLLERRIDGWLEDQASS